MSPPIRDGSGSSIGSIRLGDGTEISEVRTGAGDVLFSGTTVIENFENNLSNFGTVTDASVQSNTVQVGSGALGVDDGSSDPRGVASQPGDGLPEYPTRGARYEWFFRIDGDARFEFVFHAQSGGLGRLTKYYMELRPSSFGTNPDTLAFTFDNGNNTTIFDTDPFDLSANTGTFFKFILDNGFTTTDTITGTIEDLNGNVQATVSADPTSTADLTGGGWMFQTRSLTADFYIDQFVRVD